MECPDLNANDLRPIMILGSGSFGEVYLSETLDSELLAVKVIKDKISLSPPEVHIQSSIENHYIMSLKYMSFGEKVTMGMPAAAGDLKMLSELNLEFGNLISICRKLIEAVYCLHRNGYIHRDIKPANVLLNLVNYNDGSREVEIFEPVLIDFGLSVPVKSVVSGMMGFSDIGTAVYLPIDIISSQYKIFNQASDIWALGATLYYIFTGEQLVNIVYEKGVNMKEKTLAYLKSITQVGNGTGPYLRSKLNAMKGSKIPTVYHERVVNLLVRMLDIDRDLRPTARDLLDDPLFDIIQTPIYDCIIKDIPWPPPNKDKLDFALIKEKIKIISYGITSHPGLRIVNIAGYYWTLDIAYRYFSLPYFENRQKLAAFNSKGILTAIIVIGMEMTGVHFEDASSITILGGHASREEIGDGIGEIMQAMGCNLHRRFLFESIRSKQECVELHKILMDPYSYYNYSANPVDVYSTISPEDGIMYYTIKDIIVCSG